MEASIRQLKANLSNHTKKAAASEAVTVSVHNRPVARIVPIRAGSRAKLAELPGIRWNGGKPAGLPKGQTLRKGVSLWAWVIRVQSELTLIPSDQIQGDGMKPT
jgi:prevent-host-death family protein